MFDTEAVRSDAMVSWFVDPMRLIVIDLGKYLVMRNFLRRSVIVTAAAAPIAAMSLFTAGMSSAEPLNCVNGQFWDPITNTCQTPRPAENCPAGEYWNALSNVCRPLGQL